MRMLHKINHDIPARLAHVVRTHRMADKQPCPAPAPKTTRQINSGAGKRMTRAECMAKKALYDGVLQAMPGEFTQKQFSDAVITAGAARINRSAIHGALNDRIKQGALIITKRVKRQVFYRHVGAA